MNDKITLLVVDSDAGYASSIVDCAKLNPAFFDAAYSTTGTDGLAMIEDIKPTAAIINFLLPELDAIGILRKLRTLNRAVKPFIIVAAQTMTDSMLSMATEYGADYFIVKPQPPDEICNTIVDLLNTPHTEQPISLDEDIEIYISRFLHYMGIPAHLNGYEYIRTALHLAIDDISIISPITQKLYPKLSEIYHKSAQSIERSIRHAISVSWDRGNRKIIYDIFGVTPDGAYDNHPTNSEYIAMLADDLRLRLKHGIPLKTS